MTNINIQDLGSSDHIFTREPEAQDCQDLLPREANAIQGGSIVFDVRNGRVVSGTVVNNGENGIYYRSLDSGTVVSDGRLNRDLTIDHSTGGYIVSGPGRGKQVPSWDSQFIWHGDIVF
jgi:hypothetical protein